MYLGQFGRRILDHLLFRSSTEVHSCRCGNVRQPIPLIHAEFAHPDFDIQPVVVVNVDPSGDQMFLLHVLVSSLAAFNFGNEPPLRFREPSEEPFVPFCFICIASLWSPSGTETEEDTEVTPRPLIHNSFVERFGRRVKPSVAIVMENGLADAYGFKC